MVRPMKLGAKRLPSVLIPEKAAGDDLFTSVDREPLMSSTGSTSSFTSLPAYSPYDAEPMPATSLYEQAEAKKQRRRRLLVLFSFLVFGLFYVGSFDNRGASDESGTKSAVASTWRSAWEAAHNRVSGWSASSSEEGAEAETVEEWHAAPAEEDDYPVVAPDVVDEGYADADVGADGEYLESDNASAGVADEQPSLLPSASATEADADAEEYPVVGDLLESIAPVATIEETHTLSATVESAMAVETSVSDLASLVAIETTASEVGGLDLGSTAMETSTSMTDDADEPIITPVTPAHKSAKVASNPKLPIAVAVVSADDDENDIPARFQDAASAQPPAVAAVKPAHADKRPAPDPQRLRRERRAAHF